MGWSEAAMTWLLAMAEIRYSMHHTYLSSDFAMVKRLALPFAKFLYETWFSTASLAF